MGWSCGIMRGVGEEEEGRRRRKNWMEREARKGSAWIRHGCFLGRFYSDFLTVVGFLLVLCPYLPPGFHV